MKFKNTNKTFAIIIYASLTSGAYADMYFPPEFLSGEGEIADLSSFNADGTQPEGDYQVDIYVNQLKKQSRALHFSPVKATAVRMDGIRDQTGLVACLTREDLKNLGVKITLFPDILAADEDKCLAPGNIIPDAYMIFDFEKQRLDISIPQSAMHNQARGYIDPEYWDDGISAGLLNYRFSGNHRYGSLSDDKSYFLSLDSGINVGAWRLRDFHTLNYYNSAGNKDKQWQHIRTYVERSIVPLHSNLVVGESSTGSDSFDSVDFLGVQLATDENMFPDTLRGFAPVVRGVAESNAEVSVRQNGYNIYRTTVPPGAFEITDLSSLYTSGDLNVTVTEANGNIRAFTVPYSSVPVLQRSGQLKYSLTAGRFRNSSHHYDEPVFSQGSLKWGMPRDITVYGGMQYSSDYQSAQLGAGMNMGTLGAVSADVTQARSTLADGSRHDGQSLRFLYAHAFNPTGTTFRLTGYRYSTKGFHTLADTALKTMQGNLYTHSIRDEDGDLVPDVYSGYYNLHNTRRARFEANISQSLGELGSMYLTGVKQTYWNSAESSDSVQAGFSSTFGAASYSLSYGYTRQQNGTLPSYTNRTLGLAVSVPLDALFGGESRYPVYATFNASQDNHGNVSQQAGLSGTMLKDHNLTASVSQGYTRHSGMEGNASLGYKGGSGNANLGYSHSDDFRRLSYGVDGGVLLHRNGITLGQPMGESIVLVDTAGAPGVSIRDTPGVSTDRNGFAIKPYAASYRENRVALDTRQMDDHTDVDVSVKHIVPTKGAVVQADFAVRRGYRVLMRLTHNGKPLPFGTTVAAQDSSSIVGDGGQVYLSGLTESGKVEALWGKGDGQRCQATYHLSDSQKTDPVITFTGVCS
ncbi:fimbria/pilus outer membrane usher protein [Enterobacter wuhouensis]|uniref:fimbria/pilus outer membrane usher protein n=1 Tax=Enterobacter wuhouensis TaxID=2529381 RepID=UPI002FD1E30A